MTERELFLKARDVLEQEGWTQNANYNPGSGFCVRGALMEAYQDDVLTSTYSMAVARALERLARLINWDPVTWNDRPDRTKEEVLGLLGVAACEAGPPPALVSDVTDAPRRAGEPITVAIRHDDLVEA